MTTDLSIEQFRRGDWEQVREIYLEGITTGHATFETVAPSWEAWDAAHLPFARLVARDHESVAGSMLKSVVIFALTDMFSTVYYGSHSLRRI